MREWFQKLKFKIYTKNQLSDAFDEACKEGNVSTIRYLLTPAMFNKYKDTYNLNYGFRFACEYGHLEVVRYLLTSPELTDHADIHINNDEGFRKACEEGHLDVVKYLLTSPELTEHADIHAGGDYGFQWACINGHLEIVKYLLTSPDLQEHADIHADDDYGFRLACENGHLEVISYLLLFNGEQCIDFQKMEYNLDWAIENKYDDIICAMMQNLKKNNPFDYLECLPKIEIYSKEIYKQVKNVEMETLEINSQETSLFL